MGGGKEVDETVFFREASDLDEYRYHCAMDQADFEDGLKDDWRDMSRMEIIRIIRASARGDHEEVSRIAENFERRTGRK